MLEPPTRLKYTTCAKEIEKEDTENKLLSCILRRIIRNYYKNSHIGRFNGPASFNVKVALIRQKCPICLSIITIHYVFVPAYRRPVYRTMDHFQAKSKD